MRSARENVPVGNIRGNRGVLGHKALPPNENVSRLRWWRRVRDDRRPLPAPSKFRLCFHRVVLGLRESLPPFGTLLVMFVFQFRSHSRLTHPPTEAKRRYDD